MMIQAEQWQAQWPAQPSLTFIRQIQQDARRADVRILVGLIGSSRTPATDAAFRIENELFDLEKHLGGKEQGNVNNSSNADV